MSRIFSFEKLTAWKDSKELIKAVYLVTKKIPEEEKFGLTSQLRRSSVSVASNELGFMSDEDYKIIRSSIEKISNKLNALRKSQLNN